MFKGNKIGNKNLPCHIGIIMDGNGRWAKKRMLPRSLGHQAGAKKFKQIARYCNKIGIKYLTVYAFSTENWKRPKGEIDGILDLLRDYLKDAKNFKDENIKVLFIGDLNALPEDILELIKDAQEGSEDATGLVLNIALNYGGRNEIINAVKLIAEDVKRGILSVEQIDEQAVSERIYTAGQPNPDLVIRPSGEKRLSNFLLWQSAYSEFWFSNVLWPDFTEKHLNKAILDYQKRDRRFGGIKSKGK